MKKLICPHGDRKARDVRYNSYFCLICDVWLERACNDPACPYCPGRPEKPSQALHATPLVTEEDK